MSLHWSAVHKKQMLIHLPPNVSRFTSHAKGYQILTHLLLKYPPPKPQKHFTTLSFPAFGFSASKTIWLDQMVSFGVRRETLSVRLH